MGVPGWRFPRVSCDCLSRKCDNPGISYSHFIAIFFFFAIYLSICICVCVYLHHLCVQHTDSTQQEVRDWTQIIMLGSKDLYLLTHLHQQTALLSALESQKLGSFSKISMKQKPRHQGKSQEKWAGGFLRPSLIPGSLVFFWQATPFLIKQVVDKSPFPWYLCVFHVIPDSIRSYLSSFLRLGPRKWAP